MPSRTIKRNLINGHIETIGNVKTEGQGLMFHNEAHPIENDVVIPSQINPTKYNPNENININKFFLKLRPKSYISFD